MGFNSGFKGLNALHRIRIQQLDMKEVSSRTSDFIDL